MVLGSEMEAVDLARELGIKDSTLRHGGIIVSEKRALAARRGVGQCRSCLAGIVCQAEYFLSCVAGVSRFPYHPAA